MTETTGASVDGRRPVDVESGDELRRRIAEHDLVLVEFYTDNCGLCASVEPVVGLVARATDAVVLTVNPGFDFDTVAAYGVRSVPTFVLFEDGEEVGRLADGFVGTERLVEFVLTCE